MSLSDKQKRFCEEYILDLNATQACIRAGYSKDTAKSIGCENLTKPDLQKFIKELQEDKVEELGITFSYIALKTKEIVERSEVKDNDKLKALDQLSKLFGHYEKDNSQKKESQTIIFKEVGNPS